MKMKTMGWTLLLLLVALAGRTQAAQSIEEQTLSFSEESLGGHRIAYAIIDIPASNDGALKVADVQLLIACQDALGELTLSATSLWEDLPTDWEPLLASDESMIGLFFPAEEENAFHAEISSLLMDWTGGQSAFLVLMFECTEVNCECSPIITTGALRLTLETDEEP